jgi:prevent-host-death family protein
MEPDMPFSVSDVISLSQARATLSELAEQVKAGAEKIVTKNGESYIAIIDAERLDDVAAGRVTDARTSLQAIKRRRAASSAG